MRIWELWLMPRAREEKKWRWREKKLTIGVRQHGTCTLYFIDRITCMHYYEHMMLSFNAKIQGCSQSIWLVVGCKFMKFESNSLQKWAKHIILDSFYWKAHNNQYNGLHLLCCKQNLCLKIEYCKVTENTKNDEKKKKTKSQIAFNAAYIITHSLQCHVSLSIVYETAFWLALWMLLSYTYAHKYILLYIQSIRLWKRYAKREHAVSHFSKRHSVLARRMERNMLTDTGCK